MKINVFYNIPENSSHWYEERESQNGFNEKGVISAFDKLLSDPAFSQKVLNAMNARSDLSIITKQEIGDHILALQGYESGAWDVIKHTHTALMDLQHQIWTPWNNQQSTDSIFA